MFLFLSNRSAEDILAGDVDFSLQQTILTYTVKFGPGLLKICPVHSSMKL